MDLGGAVFERVPFKLPPCNALLSHCQMLCAAENIPFCATAICDLIEYARHDIRRIFNTLQLWGPRNSV